MTIKECIDAVDSLKPNQYTLRDKVQWLSSVDEGIINDVLKTHEGYDGRYDNFTGYTEDNLTLPLIVQSPYDKLYTAFLVMKIDLENDEIQRYNNSSAIYNSHMMEFRKYYNKTHMPLSVGRRDAIPPKKQNVGLSEIEFENLKRILFHMLSELFADMTSRDKLYDIVTEFAKNNIELLKGRDGIGENAVVNLISTSLEDVNDKISQIGGKVDLLFEKSFTKTVAIVLLAANWVKDSDNQYSQVISIHGVTEYSKIDLQPTAEQLAIFREKDVSFVAENEDGEVTIYCIGRVPLNDYTIQATISEVIVNV
jgi:hypothetical protein